MAKTVRLDLDQRKDQYEFTVWLDGVHLATMKAVPWQRDILVHLNVHAWSRGLYREYVCCFIAVREFLREEGFMLIIASSDRSDDKMQHFWRLMGFRCFGEFEKAGRKIAYAVMEV